MKRVLAGLALGMLSLDGAAAADIPLKAPRLQPVYDWTGLYFGAHAGFGRGHSSAVLSDPSIATTTTRSAARSADCRPATTFNCRRGSCSGSKPTFHSRITSTAIPSFRRWRPRNPTSSSRWISSASARGRLGYAAGPWLFYATGGLAFTGERFLNTPAIGNDEKKLSMRLGWAAGGGVEYAFAPHWSLRLEYLYSQFQNAGVQFASGAATPRR